MRERSLLLTRPMVRSLTTAIDVVLLTPRERTLAVLVQRTTDPRLRDRWTLPWDAPRTAEPPEQAAERISRAVLGIPPAALEQIGAFGDERRHPGDAQLSVAFVGLVPHGPATANGDNGTWVDREELPLLPPRH